MAGSVNRLRRRYEFAAAAPVVAFFATLYAWIAATLGPHRTADMFWTAVLFLIPMSLWLFASWLLVDQWWTRAGAQLSTMDGPSQVLAAAVATLPASRRRWGEAMLSELARVRGRSARWRFALSCARAAVSLPAPPTFRVPAPAATVLVMAAVAACVAALATLLARHPAAIEGLTPGRAAALALALAACLWVAAAPPRRLGDSRLAPHLGVAGAAVFALGIPVSTSVASEGLPALWLLFGPVLTFGIPAYAAATASRSFRAGVQSGVWTAVAAVPLTFALGLFEAVRQYAAYGVPTFAGDASSAGFSFGFGLLMAVAIPLIGFPFAVFGATGGIPAGPQVSSPRR